MSGPGSDEDAIAPTLAASNHTLAERSSRPALDHLLPGSQVGRYRLKARLGAGAMGVVWSAHDPKLDRDVAIKLVHAELASEEASTRLMREAKAMAKLSHRSVITVYDADDVDGKLFLAMELVRGTTLGQILRERDAAAIADWRKWLAMMLDAGRGLAEAHRNGVLHRDFKPDNVLVDSSGRVCVGDFGLATLGDSIAGNSRQWSSRPPSVDEPSALELTTTGALLGTPIYMGPQQLRGESIDARADQFAFCVATWEALYGARPFVVAERGMEAIASLLAAIERGPPAPPEATAVPAAVGAVLARGLAVEPAARWSGMDALLVAIEDAVRQGRATVPVRRRRLPIVIGALVLAIVAGVAILLLARGEPHVERRELFSVPLRSRIAMSNDGSLLAVAGRGLLVQRISGGDPWQIELPGPAPEVLHLEVDADQVQFSISQRVIHRWRYRAGEGLVVMAANLAGRWRGNTIEGDVFELDDHSLVIRDREAPDRDIAHIASVNFPGSVVISPDRRRLAFLDQDRFAGAIVVHDVVSGRRIHSGRLLDPTALAWIDDRTLIYALAESRSTIYRVTVGEDALEVPTEIYSIENGWFGRICGRGSTIFAVELRPTPRGHLLERRSAIERTDFERGAIPLVWTSATSVLAWNHESRRVVRYTDGAVVQTAAELPSEPANTTTSGDTLIAAVRRTGGRDVLAVPLAGGPPRWTHTDGKTLAVRCAGDRRPPCFAIRTGDSDQLFTIDPETGSLGTSPILTGKSRTIEDVAVRADGLRIAIVGGGAMVREFDAAGTAIREHHAKMNLTRSIAYDPAGGLIVAGSGMDRSMRVGAIRTTYVAHAVGEDGNVTVLQREGDGVLMLVRPSEDGKRITTITRPYEPLLVELTLP